VIRDSEHAYNAEQRSKAPFNPRLASDTHQRASSTNTTKHSGEPGEAHVALVVWLIVRSSHGKGGGPSSSAKEILSERFARGEIDADEYHDRLSKLR
jgi:hypothetical protein